MDRLEQVLAIINLNIKFVFNGVMDEHACFDVHLVVFVVPVRLESDWHTVPSVWVDMSQTLATYLDDALGHHMGLLVQMDVVLVRVVESAECSD